MANEEEIVGATIAGKYRIRRFIGGGSMGVVCEAEHLEIGKRVAIKLIDASLSGMSDVAMRFRQEARTASLVESHHIVQVFDVGTDDRLGLYLVMEYLTGEDLARILARERRLSQDEAVRIAVQVARGLAKAHEAGVVHRDLKPANIFLCASEDDQPRVKILDFGISKVLASSRPGCGPGLKLTRDGMVVGTPQYMSPEQAQGYSVDERTDIWALGLVLYEMLAGRPAYPELPTYEQFIIHLVSKAPDSLREVAPWVTEDLANVVHSAIEHDLKQRVQSCTELVKRLIEAHPLHTAAVREPSAIETTDTWSDPAALSFDESEVKPRPSSRRRTTTEPSPQAPLASLVSSGVRGSFPEAAPPLEDFQEDAPQFFDRKLLQTMATGPSTSSDGTSPTPPGRGRNSKKALFESAKAEGTASRSGAAHRSRSALGPGLGWAGLALLLLGLAVAAALALR
jgi:serine/threonine protein kinase